MIKLLQSSFLLLLFLILIQFDPSEAGNIAVYWGRNGSEGTLTETCATGRYSFVIISSLAGLPNGQPPELDQPGHCGSECTEIGTEIKYCQKQGIKVMLSLGGPYWYFNLQSPEDAPRVSDYLWSNFLGGSSSSRPFGDATLDGIYFGMGETKSISPYLDELARELKSHSNDSQYVYLSAVLQCLFPNPVFWDALSTGLFDFVWVQFYNNPRCDYTEANADNFANAWNQWITSFKGAKIFLGLPASPEVADSGYVPANLLMSKVLPIVTKSANYRGMMLWSRYEDKQSGYSTSIQIGQQCR